jgi:hypothetical protein
MSKIISISVWGNAPSYCVGAIKNAELAKELFPDWTCRIFVDQTVPTHYVDELLKFSNVELAQVDNSNLYGMFWRFYSMFQNEDDIVISRDSDSRLSKRELRCVNEWIESDKKFSIIRDHYPHYDWPILGGMWGMKGKLDDEILSLMEKYAQNHAYAVDQVFLRDVIWPKANKDCIIHGFLEVEWMKQSREKDYFIGQGYNENDEPLYSGEKTGERIR